MSVSKVSLFIGFMVLLIFPIAAEDSNCTTADCHKNILTMKHIHAPVAVDCTTCHEKAGEHQFKRVREKICLECHEDKKKGKQVHEVVASGECTSCHYHHGGDNKALLKSERIDTLCYNCHDKEPMEKKYTHGPNAPGNCALCHAVHSSDYGSLLVEPEASLCIRCHSDQDFTGGGKHQHSPLKTGCTGCHNPHASGIKYLLVSSSDSICSKCHEKITSRVGIAKFKHPVVQQKGTCYNCHDPHGSLYKNNLKAPPLQLCLGCHNKPIIGADGKDYNIYTIVTQKTYKHGPINDGNCTGCHDPHGSEYYKILKNSFPRSFYVSYETSEYALCFQCHDNALAKLETTTTLTNFRDGSRNLHYIHVNREKGRTCRACHEIHAGTLPFHIREEAPFGTWDIPLHFEKTANGGSCSPGCHKPFSYSRTTRLNRTDGKSKQEK